MTDEARLDELRRTIAELDAALIDVLARRLATAVEIGTVKANLGLPVLDPAREAEVVRRAAARARECGVDAELVRDVLWRVMAQARGVQDVRPRDGT